MTQKHSLFLWCLIALVFVFLGDSVCCNIHAQRRSVKPPHTPTPAKTTSQESKPSDTQATAPVNEPTLEETLAFINDKLQQEVSFAYKSSGGGLSYVREYLNQRVAINGSRIRISYEMKRTSENDDRTFKSIQTTTYNSESFIEYLSTNTLGVDKEINSLDCFNVNIFGAWRYEARIDEVVNDKRATDTTRKDKTAIEKVRVCPKEMAERVDKAFNHLIKLLSKSKKEPF